MATVISLGVAVQDFVFSVDEIPTEARKYRAKDLVVVGGGCAATAAVAVARLGGNCHLISRLGNDITADIIVGDLESDNVNCAGVKRFDGYKSPLSSIMVDQSGERLVVGYRDEKMPTDPGFVADYFGAPDAVLADSRWAEGAVRLFELAAEKQIPAVLDGEMPFGAVERAAAHLATHPVFSAQGLQDYAKEPDVLTALLAASASREGRWTAVTDGPNGVYVAHNGLLSRLPGHQMDVVDTLGAGDVWHGAFALALAEGKNAEQAIMFASGAAALKCTQFGGRKGTPSREILNNFLETHPLQMEPISL
ncbi:PfkB family carbohydrate kinase [Pararhizobium sp. IMCC21322]|uniref:PfkB family carbohydrate kinase n=1 Tax=Pararhizobium sp. IMCC21322 TaxID=3067903 RepID=UPI002740D1C0|nr:PfkB family carbohydrate kinase [Pararhizobium sp. IMCC21322]